jgi:succinyl-CoA synthetase beta subunit
MNLLEYEAKNILRKFTIPVPTSEIISSPTDTILLPAVLKSQVPTGGRGKAGGIKVVKELSLLSNSLSELFNLEIKGYHPRAILAEELLNIKNEYYLSLIIDRESASIQLVANKNGGVEVEDNSPDSFLKIILDNDNFLIAGERLAEYFDLPGQTFVLQELIKNLYICFIESDATLLEINPLILTAEDKLIAGDCKMVLDDAASFRHPDWDFEETAQDTNFVTLNEQGTVATIANGAGLAMATVDAVADVGLLPANFLDIGGGANEASTLEAFQKIVTYPNIQAIVINIFAGITRCDEVAKAIIAAKKKINNLPPLYIRLAGTNFEQAAELLKNENIPLQPTLEACLAAVKSEVSV